MKDKKGLENYQKIIGECADCGTPLLEFWVTISNETLIKRGIDPITNKILVKCGICGGRSYIKTVNGSFHVGAASDDIVFEPLDEQIEDCDYVFKAWKS